MDAKLKALKVAELKAVLAKANVSAPAKATKADLIARVQASQPARDGYAILYPTDDLLAPPEDVDWNVDPVVSPVPAVAPAPAPATVTATAPAPATASTAPAPALTADAELEKRRQRAARFGIPFDEPAAKRSLSSMGADEKRKLRTARFGQSSATTTSAPPANRSLKRPAKEESVDPDELERRKKRAERFGVPIKP